VEKKMPIEKNGHTRLTLIKKLLSEKTCSHILITDAVDCEYLSGFHASNIFLLISRKENFLFTDFRYKEAAELFCRRRSFWKFVEVKENGFSILASYCPPGKSIGFQSDSMPVDVFDTLTKRLKNVRLIKLKDAISAVFIPKLTSEITKIKKAAKIGDAAFSRVLRYVKTGMTERDLSFLLENQCRRLGSEKPSFETIVLFGKRSALPHGRPSDARLKKGDFILMDFGCFVDGFVSDMTRTIVAGPATVRQKAIYAIVARAQKKAREAVRETVMASVVDQKARQIIENAGYGAYFGHATGHGVGRLVHEKPKIASTSRTLLPSGAVITIEPGIYIPDFGGVRIEDMVVVRKNGGEIITGSTHRLIEGVL
jgi:Xaa-Pro aminopeptidase